jgi:hypothetical protein
MHVDSYSGGVHPDMSITVYVYTTRYDILRVNRYGKVNKLNIVYTHVYSEATRTL